jgi:hypothetical protein
MATQNPSEARASAPYEHTHARGRSRSRDRAEDRYDSRSEFRNDRRNDRHRDYRSDERHHNNYNHNNRVNHSNDSNRLYGGGNERNSQNNQHCKQSTVIPIKEQPIDNNLANVYDDPRVREDGRKIVKIKGGGRNTESFDPRSTLVRPGMRIIVGPNREVYGKPLKHDDVVICPEFLCTEDDWKLYYDLVKEMREAQAAEEKGSEWISWAEGAHLISKNPNSSSAYNKIQEKIAKYFDIERKSVGTRFNWYRDSSDWKPFHHDSAAFNPQRARNQNITVGVSLGSTRELAFMHAKTGERLYFPQTNGMLFSFGRDVNIGYKHGINALPESEQDGKGRVSIILWGLVKNTVEEDGSPRILDENTRGRGHSIHATNSNGICRDFQKNSCSRGSSCRFSHQMK